MLAAATRELGVISIARVRAWFVEQFQAGEHVEILRHVSAGGSLEEVLVTLPIMDDYHAGLARLQRALELFDSLGDRRGAMSTVIAMAYLSWARTSTSARARPGGSRRSRSLASSMQSLSRESARAAAEVQMLYGVHVFCRSKVIPDLAIARGREAYERARELGERSLEFLSAGGTALASLEIGDLEGARRWLDRAAQVASSVPTAYRSRQVELWRGLIAAGAGDVLGLEDHMNRALGMAAGADRRAARCEILAITRWSAHGWGSIGRTSGCCRWLPSWRARLGRWRPSCPGGRRGARRPMRPRPLRFGTRASAAGRRTREARTRVPGRGAARGPAPRDPRAGRAGAVRVRRGGRDDRGRARRAAGAGRADQPADRGPGDPRALVGGADGACAGRVGRRARASARRARGCPARADERIAERAADEQLLSLLVEGRTDEEMAEVLGVTPERIAQQLSALYGRMGARTRVDATVLALTGQL